MFRALLRKLQGNRPGPTPIPRRAPKPDIMSPDLHALFYLLTGSIVAASVLVIAALFIRFA
jgi:hypothetical protein